MDYRNEGSSYPEHRGHSGPQTGGISYQQYEGSSYPEHQGHSGSQHGRIPYQQHERSSNPEYHGHPRLQNSEMPNQQHEANGEFENDERNNKNQKIKKKKQPAQAFYGWVKGGIKSVILPGDAEKINMKEMQKNYKEVMSNLGGPGKVKIQTYVDALEESNDRLTGENQTFIGFRSRVVEVSNNITGLKSQFHEESAETAFEKLVNQCLGLDNDKSRLKGEVEKLKQKLSVAERNAQLAENKNLDLERRHESKVEELNGKHQLEITIQQSKYEGDLRDQKTEHEDALQQYSARLHQTEEQYKSELTTTQTKWNTQYQTLQGHFLEGSDDFQPRPDSEFETDMNRIKSKVKKLSDKQNNLRSSLIDNLEIGRSFLQGKRKASEKTLVLESAIWQIIQEGLFKTPFQALGDYGREKMYSIWVDTCSPRKKKAVEHWLEPSTNSEKLRHVLMLTIRENSLIELEPDSDISTSYQENIHEVSKQIEQMLEQDGPPLTDNDITTIQEIVSSAAKLSLECSLQRSRIQLFMLDTSATPQKYNKGLIHDRNLRNHSSSRNDNVDADSVDGIIELCIAPGLKRYGDNRGGSWGLPPKTLYKADVFMNRTS